jgi:hypothetical protein
VEPEHLRFADILTTASAVANYLGQPTVSAAHLLDAIAILRGATSLDDLGRPVSPLLRRATEPGGGVDPAIRELAQRWFAALGASVAAELDVAQLSALVAELEGLRGASES